MKAGTEWEKDNLTGLLSRRGMETLLASYGDAPEISLTLLTVQIARFGNVNSGMGVELGDRIISLASKRLSKLFPNATALARPHGDHLCMLFEGDQDIETELERLHDFTQRPFAVRGKVVVLNVKVGIATTDDPPTQPALLLQASEIALQDAKRTKLKTSHFSPSMVETAQHVHHMENDLRVALVNHHVEIHRAMANEEFFLVYQPIVDATTGAVVAFEALMRWNHPQRGLIRPDVFIAFAEKMQIMDILGTWVIQRAIYEASNWPLRPDGRRVGVSVNVSPTQFVEPRILLQGIREALDETEIDPSLIKFEVTETSDFAETMKSTLERIRQLGCCTSLDDFGTGFSSLTQLNDLPLDYLKLDRSFIAELDSSNEDQARLSRRITQAILTLAETFQVEPIVEGIETDEQLATVRKLGARLIQGFYFSKPLSGDRVADFIRAVGGK